MSRPGAAIAIRGGEGGPITREEVVQSILVAGDPGVDPASLVAAAAHIARATGAPLHILERVREAEGMGTRAAPAIAGAVAGALFDEDRVRWTRQATSRPLREEVVGRCEEGRHDLVVLSLRGGGRALDPEVVQIALRVDVAVLITKGPMRWPPQTILMPLGEADIEAGALPRALDWLSRARPRNAGAAAVPPALATLQVLRLTAGVDSMRRVIVELDRHLTGIDARLPAEAGTQIRRRIEPAGGGRDHGLRWIEHESADLVILRRHEVGPSRPSPQELVWLRLLLASRSAVLLLPREIKASPGVFAGAPAATGSAG